MSFEKQIEELAAARGRDISQLICERLQDLYNEMGETNFKRIVSEVTMADSVPTNLYGVIKRFWITLKYEQEKTDLIKENWPTKEECVSPEEWRVYADILLEIFEWHELGLVQRNPNGTTKPMSVDEYIKAGQPDTWSPMVDHFLRGFVGAYKIDLNRAGTLFQYMKTYHKTLIDSKNARLNKEKKFVNI